MIHANGCQHTDRRCRNDIGRVLSAAHAAFYDGNVAVLLCHPREREHGFHFKCGRNRLAVFPHAIAARDELCHPQCVIRLGNHRFVYAPALTRLKHSRRAICADAIPCRPQDRCDAGQRRAFSIGACDVHDWIAILRVAQPCKQMLHRLQTQYNALLRGQTCDILPCLLIRHGTAAQGHKRIRNCAVYLLRFHTGIGFFVPLRELRIARICAVNLRQVQDIRQRQGFLIQPRAAADKHIASGGVFQRRAKAGHGDTVPSIKILGLGNHDGLSARQRNADFLIRPSAHDDDMTHREIPKPMLFLRNIPRDAPIPSDDSILCKCGDQRKHSILSRPFFPRSIAYHIFRHMTNRLPHVFWRFC